MPLRAYMKGGELRIGEIQQGGLRFTGFSDLPSLIKARPAAWRNNGPDSSPVESPTASAPILPVNSQLLFCGFNYKDHLKENPDAHVPRTPFFFTKLPNAVIGPRAPIVVPYRGCKVDYEAELAVVIGRKTRRISAEDAVEHIFGYTVVNDVTARDIQFVDTQHTVAKGVDTFCPASDELVLRDELPDITDVPVRSWVNGELRQSSTTAQQMFPIGEMIEFLSRTMTLQPGDVLSTGTPAGVGHFRNPPEYLAPGDTVTVEVEGVGSVTNPVVAGWAEQ